VCVAQLRGHPVFALKAEDSLSYIDQLSNTVSIQIWKHLQCTLLRNGDNVALTPPTPKPIKIMAAVRPGTPDPCSKLYGRDVANIIAQPQPYSLDRSMRFQESNVDRNLTLVK
jgi:hypothetical protein